MSSVVDAESISLGYGLIAAALVDRGDIEGARKVLLEAHEVVEKLALLVDQRPVP